MPVILNCLDDEQTVVVGGNHFHFKAREMKLFTNPHLANILAIDKKDMGFVALPEDFEEAASIKKPELRDSILTAEQKSLIEAKRKEGVELYCSKLRAQIYNLQVSLRKDLEKNNDKTDPRVHASKGDLKAMHELVKYQSKKEDAEQKRIDEFKELEKQLQKG